uniref:Uncharacterized protein n=1 Tax=Aceria tosichella TaxID=561515 RepID=A0A6G1SPZ0_9ACAR
MKITRSLQIVVRKVGPILLITTLASSVILCAPGPQQQQQQQQQHQQSNAANANQKSQSFSSISSSSSSVHQTGATAPGAGVTTATTVGSLNNGGRQLSSVASELNSMPSLVSLRDASPSARQQSGPVKSGNNDESDAFDGKNPFTDDSLWQIPIHFVRELSSSSSSDPSINSASNDNMAKSASELTASADEHDDELGDGDSIGIGSILDHQNQQQQPRPSGASLAPAVISASTAASGAASAADLKTAAGYHHATPHHYGGGHHDHHGGYGAGHYGAGHHDAGHYGAGHHDAGHYGAGHHDGHHDHYGKYFQYASVPYPYAWDFGYKRGNPYHTIERYEHGKGPHFQTKVKWSDKHGGYGVHVWDYNHDDHSKHHYGGGDYDHHHHNKYDAHGPTHYGSHGHH